VTLVVVGASLAGIRAVETLRSEGYDGRLVLVGAEPHLPYDRPPLSKEVLRGDWGTERLPLRRKDYDELELELRLGRRAVALDAAAREVELDDGARLGFDGLLIATGAQPRTLPGTGGLEGVHVLRTVDDALALRADLEAAPARVVVVGGGFIGAEVAASCRARGLEVTMVEPLPAPMERGIGREMGALMAEVHRDHGVDLRLGTGVDAIEGGARVERVKLGDGSVVDADTVVVGIGVAPATDWLESSGIALDDGVVCDASCATSIPGVFAAGDVARAWHPVYGRAIRVEHWTHAVEQGVAAARSLLGHAEPFDAIPLFWSDQYDRKIQLAGLPEFDGESRVVHGSLDERKFVRL
jgi:3-phenylpropionate/trans-cinnamate dioxygenase ferredoxin reductase subunit